MCSSPILLSLISLSFHFKDTATTEIYTLSLHDALPISLFSRKQQPVRLDRKTLGMLFVYSLLGMTMVQYSFMRSEEHTSELQSRGHLVCRLLLEKKKYDNKD